MPACRDAAPPDHRKGSTRVTVWVGIPTRKARTRPLAIGGYVRPECSARRNAELLIDRPEVLLHGLVAVERLRAISKFDSPRAARTAISRSRVERAGVPSPIEPSPGASSAPAPHRRYNATAPST